MYSDSTRQARVSPEFLRTIRRKNSIVGGPGMSSRAALSHSQVHSRDIKFVFRNFRYPASAPPRGISASTTPITAFGRALGQGGKTRWAGGHLSFRRYLKHDFRTSQVKLYCRSTTAIDRAATRTDRRSTASGPGLRSGRRCPGRRGRRRGACWDWAGD